MQSKATTVEAYLAELPEERRTALTAIRKVIRKNLDKDFEEGMQYGMIGYYVPHKVYPPGYHCDPKQPLPFCHVASQKNYISVYLMTVYGKQDEEDWFRNEWEKTGKKLNMGKCCIRFKKLEDAALDVIGQAIQRVSAQKHIQFYESVIKPSNSNNNMAKKKKSIAKPSSSSSTSKTKRPAKASTVNKSSASTARKTATKNTKKKS